MSKIIFVVSVAFFVTVLVSRDAMSAPQWSTSLGGMNGTTISGGGVGGDGNGNSSVPGSGYPEEYYEAHSNDTSPTSPSVSGGSLNMQNSTSTTNICNCNQEGGSDNGNAPGGSNNSDAPGGSDIGNGDSGAESQN